MGLETTRRIRLSKDAKAAGNSTFHVRWPTINRTIRARTAGMTGSTAKSSRPPNGNGRANSVGVAVDVDPAHTTPWITTTACPAKRASSMDSSVSPGLQDCTRPLERDCFIAHPQLLLDGHGIFSISVFSLLLHFPFASFPWCFPLGCDSSLVPIFRRCLPLADQHLHFLEYGEPRTWGSPTTIIF